MVFDAEFNSGTKALNYTGIKRMKALAEWAMNRPEDTVVCVGHSLYFRSFFRVRRGGEKSEKGGVCVSVCSGRASPCALLLSSRFFIYGLALCGGCCPPRSHTSLVTLLSIYSPQQVCM